MGHGECEKTIVIQEMGRCNSIFCYNARRRLYWTPQFVNFDTKCVIFRYKNELRADVAMKKKLREKK